MAQTAASPEHVGYDDGLQVASPGPAPATGVRLEDVSCAAQPWELHVPAVSVTCLAGVCAAVALVYYLRTVHRHVEQLETAVYARAQRVELLCEQLRTALATGRVQAADVHGTGAGASAGAGAGASAGAGTSAAVTLASMGGIDINLGATIQPDATTMSRWLVNAAQWLWRT